MTELRLLKVESSCTSVLSPSGQRLQRVSTGANSACHDENFVHTRVFCSLHFPTPALVRLKAFNVHTSFNKLWDLSWKKCME